jgi:spore coat polysaccharide biosynthesis protein SpsF
MKNDRNEQEKFWALNYSKDYIKKNSDFNQSLLLEGWAKILKNVDTPKHILECGANVGRNIQALNIIFPEAKKTAIEISVDAAAIIQNKFSDLEVINSSILDSGVEVNSYDLVFTMCVLIHIHPKHLLENLNKVISSSKKYVVVGEYFNRTPVSITYQGEEDKLFKRDFGKYILDHFGDELTLVDHGFLWGHLYDDGGFDDITWWVFEK